MAADEEPVGYLGGSTAEDDEEVVGYLGGDAEDDELPALPGAIDDDELPALPGAIDDAELPALPGAIDDAELPALPGSEGEDAYGGDPYATADDPYATADDAYATADDPYVGEADPYAAEADPYATESAYDDYAYDEAGADDGAYDDYGAADDGAYDDYGADGGVDDYPTETVDYGAEDDDSPKTISQQDAESIIRQITTKRILPPDAQGGSPLPTRPQPLTHSSGGLRMGPIVTVLVLVGALLGGGWVFRAELYESVPALRGVLSLVYTPPVKVTEQRVPQKDPEVERREKLVDAVLNSEARAFGTTLKDLKAKKTSKTDVEVGNPNQQGDQPEGPK